MSWGRPYAKLDNGVTIMNESLTVPNVSFNVDRACRCAGERDNVNRGVSNPLRGNSIKLTKI